jgi:hypothetical protein
MKRSKSFDTNTQAANPEDVARLIRCAWSFIAKSESVPCQASDPNKVSERREIPSVASARLLASRNGDELTRSPTVSAVGSVALRKIAGVMFNFSLDGYDTLSRVLNRPLCETGFPISNSLFTILSQIGRQSKTNLFDFGVIG